MKQTRTEVLVLLTAILLVTVQLCQGVEATEIYNDNDVVVASDSYVYRSVSLAEGGGMAVFFRITNGDGITFFIVDSFGHAEIQAGRSAPTPHNQRDYARNGGVWWRSTFVAPDTDVWYVYFSKDYGTTYNTGIAAELDIIIRTETDGPSITVSSSIPDVVRGTLTISFSIHDDCFGIDRVEVWVDGVLVDTIQGNADSNYFESQFAFSSYNWVNGNHTISFRAYDTYGHESTPYEVQVNSQNEWYDNPWLLGLALLVAFGIVVVCIYCLKRY